MNNIILAALSVLALATACSKVEDSETKIVNGRAVTSTSPAYSSAVRLDLGGGLCTGTVIAPKLILTAAHCLENIQAANIKVLFDRLPSGSPARNGRVARINTFKGFGAERFPNFDVAYLELATEVPAPYAPMEILRDGNSLTSETPIILAGYGNQSDDCQTSTCVGVLRETNTRFEQYYDKAHIMSLLIFHGTPAQGFGSACNGDSGGPAYAQVGSKWYLVGITNGLRGDIVPQADGTCASGWDIYTFAGDYSHWLESQNALTLIKDSVLNPDPAILPQLVVGPQQKTKPTTWAEWVTYSNHEDPAWYTVDSVLQNLIGKAAEATRVFPVDATEMLYNPARTEGLAATVDTLYLQSESIGDISPLKSFLGLKQLYLDGTSVKDLSPLAGKSGLTFLGIRDVPADAKTDFFNSLGAARSSLQVLSVENVASDLVNAIDWSALSGITEVSFEKTDGVVDLSRFKPRSSAAISIGLGSSDVEGTLDTAGASIRLLQLDSLRSSDDQDLRSMVNWDSLKTLPALDLRGFTRAELPDLKALPALKDVSLSNNRISTLSDLSLPEGIDSLDVSGNQLTTLDLKVVGVKALRAYDNPLAEVTCPAGQCLTDTHIIPKAFNDYCENAVDAQKDGYTQPYYSTLAMIQAQTTGDSRLSCRTLEQFVPRMRYAMLSGAGIRDIRPLAFVNQLVYLVLDDNEISDLSPIAGMSRLEYLSASGNQIHRLPSFKSFTNLKEINLLNNPLDRLTVDGPSLVQVVFGKESGVRVRKEFELRVSDAPSLQNLVYGGIELSAESLDDMRNTFSLRSIQSFDAQIVNTKDYSDMLSLQLTSPTLDLSEGCSIINGVCVKLSESGASQAMLGPILGTIEGSRVESKTLEVILPGMPSTLQSN